MLFLLRLKDGWWHVFNTERSARGMEADFLLWITPPKDEQDARSILTTVGNDPLKIGSLENILGATIRMESENLRQGLRARVLEQLNQLVEADREAMHQLAEARVPVNEKIEKLSGNDTVLYEDESGKPLLGVIGIINGILGPKHKIAGFYEDDGKLSKFVEAKS